MKKNGFCPEMISPCLALISFGGCRGIRTPNLVIWNHSLYRWSYTPKPKKKANQTFTSGWLSYL